ncbi:MAG: phytase [Bacteroidota bacterium]
MMNKFTFISTIVFALYLLFTTGCTSKQKEPETVKSEHESFYEDSIELAEAYEAQSKILNSIAAQLETEPVEANAQEDAADDPAIWYNKTNPSGSLIFGSNKRGGLIASDLKGKNVKYYPLGSINNVDILYDYSLEGEQADILGCSNRTTQAIDLFKIDALGNLERIVGEGYLMETSKIDDIYGFCFGRNGATNTDYVFINGKNGLMQQFQLIQKDKNINLELIREVQFESQTEGMVVDYSNQKLYVGEENKGIWMLDIDPQNSQKEFLLNSGKENANIKFDIEGLTIYNKGNLSLLIASSQGNFSYAVFDINAENNYLGSFKINGNETIDGVEETDGIDIISDSLSSEFPYGLLVAQDGFNYEYDSLAAQNFKFCNVRDLLSTLDLNN